MDTPSFKVFIASSLALRKDIQDVKKAVNTINNRLEREKSYFRLSTFDYLDNSEMVQKLEKGEAQEPVRRYLKESLIFFLIVRGRVGNLTISEYEDAIKRFNKGKFPQYIFIFYSKGEEHVDYENSISFEDFEKKYISVFQLDSAYRLIEHKNAYFIPYGDSFPSLESQLTDQLTKLINSDEWPFPGSINNQHIDKTYFYSDENRLNQCRENIYFRRPFDNELDDAISNSQIIFLHGVSLSGKTRAVMNLLTQKDDGWFFCFPRQNTINRDGSVSSTMEQILSYCQKKPNHPLHYFFIDDIHELDFTVGVHNDKETIQRNKIAELFLKASLNGEFKLIVTSTRHFSNTFLSLFLDEENEKISSVYIPEMNNEEFFKAKEFFKGYGLIHQNQRMGYNTPGALLIDLSDIQKTYNSFIKIEDRRFKRIRLCFLKAIKASSIWKNTHFGELSIISKLTSFFLNEPCSDEDLYYAIDELIEKPLCGITKVGDELNIQEYVYRYLIDCKGNISNSNNLENEKQLVKEVMSYCCLYEKETPLTVQASKLGSRTEHRKEIGSWFYKIYIEDYQDDESEWITKLKEERKKYESDEENVLKEDNTYVYYYSKMFSNAFDKDTPFDEAFAIYSRASTKLRSSNLLADLMRCAKNEKDWTIIKELNEYEKYVFNEKDPFVLGRLMSLQKNFDDVLAYFNSIKEGFSDKYKPHQIAKYRIKALEQPIKDENDRSLKRDIYPLDFGIETLARTVSNKKNLEELISIIRDYYFIKVNDRSVLSMIADHTLDIKARASELTLVDLLSVISILSLRKAIQGSYGPSPSDENIETKLLEATNFVTDSILPCLKETLSHNYTDEVKIRRTVSAIINAIIESYHECSYERLRDTVFKAAKFQHPTDNRHMVFIDCYSYLFMLKSNKCNTLNARNLLEEYLIPHTNDKSNPIVISVILLNTIINNLWNDAKKRNDEKKETGRSIISNIYPSLYEKYHIHPDLYTYNTIISTSSNKETAIDHINKMIKTGVAPDQLTMCFLASKLDDLRSVLSLIDIPDTINLPLGYELKNALPKTVKNNSSISLLRKTLINSKKFWVNLFYHTITTDEDRHVALLLFDYLKRYQPDLLSDGQIKNILIKNNTIIIDFDSVKSFIYENTDNSFPDSYTFSGVTRRLADLRGKDKMNQLSYYNDLTQKLYEKGIIDWSYTIPLRLLLFSSTKEQLSLLFWNYDENGEINFYTQQVTPNAYIQNIKKNSYDINENKLYESIHRIEGGKTELLTLVNELFPSTKEYSKNQLLIHDYLKGDYNDGIWEAVQSIDWKNHTSGIQAFNIILNKWTKENSNNPDRFEIALNIYDYHISKRGGNSETFSILAKCANNKEDIYIKLYPIFDKTKLIRKELNLDNHFLSSVYRLGESCFDLKKFTQVFEQKGGKPDVDNAASMLRYMLRYPSDKESDNTLQEVCMYLFEKDKTELNINYKPICLINKESVSGQILYTAIVYSERKNLYNQNQIIDSLTSNYRKQILDWSDSGLLAQLNKNTRKGNTIYIFQLLTKILEYEKIRTIPNAFLKGAVKGMNNYNDYFSLIMALRNTECQNIDDIIEPLIIRLYSQGFGNRWIENTDNKYYLTESRKLFSKIVTFSKLNCLKNLHLLPSNTDTLQANNWDTRSLDCAKIRAIVKDVVGQRTLAEQIKYAINNLDNRYILSIKSIYHHERTRLTIDDWSKERITQYEIEYAKRIKNHDISFEEITEIPTHWIKSGWIPGIEIIAAMFIAYKKISFDNSNTDIKEEAIRYYHGISSMLRKSKEKGYKTVTIYYYQLGRLKETMNKYHVTVDRRAFYCNTKKYIGGKRIIKK